jgi:uncharacterized protein (TIGR02646 family)
VIRVPVPPAPAEFSDPESSFARERAKALAFFKRSANQAKSFSFKAYKSKTIVNALNEHFGFKCAYCESFYGATAPVDIEHYRPKGEIVDGKKTLRPGYYWLAVEWTNLLPSCRDCNSQRKHEFPYTGIQLRGKGNLFPIANPKRRATKPGEEGRERRLLLHPYLDEPRQHLKFTKEGAIQPTIDDRKRPSKVGDTSIHVYGLDRPVLAMAREKRAIEILGHIKKLRQVLELLDTCTTSDQRLKTEELLQTEIAALKQKLEPREVYAGMARQFAEDFLNSL